MFLEAQDEFEKLPAKIKNHPAVQHFSLFLLVKLGKWEEGVLLGESLCKLWPLELGFYMNTALCLHLLGRTNEAKAILVSTPKSIRDTAKGMEGNYCYDLACYECQLGNLDEAKRLLRECLAREPQYREEALKDPDLEPLREAVAVEHRYICDLADGNPAHGLMF
jgi:tetratricopeptide (TPR) repeat protein